MRIIAVADYKKYIENKPNNKIETLWASIVSQLSSEKLKKEARYKGFALIPQQVETEGIPKTFVIVVVNGSQVLQSEVERLDNLIGLIK